MSDLQQATITIDSITEKGNRVSIKTTSGGSYSFFKKKQDGTPSVAAKQLTDMELKSGMTVDIAYDTSAGEFQGKSITYKNIKSFREPSIQVGEPQHKVPAFLKVEPKADNRDYFAENWGKCRYGFLLEMYKKDVSLDKAKQQSSDWADVAMSKREIDVSDIPF
jgi:hypothetical protein